VKNQFSDIARKAAEKTDRELGIDGNPMFDVKAMTEEQKNAAEGAGIMIVRDLQEAIERENTAFNQIENPSDEALAMLQRHENIYNQVISIVRKRCGMEVAG